MRENKERERGGSTITSYDSLHLIQLGPLYQFVPAHLDNYEFADLSGLVHKLKNFTTIPLRCSKPEEAIRYVI